MPINNDTSNIGFQITKTVAISSLGIYTGLLTTSSIVNLCGTPVNGIKKTLNNIYCKLGETGSAIGALTVSSFALSYYLERTNSLWLYGLLSVPISGFYLWCSSKGVEFFAKFKPQVELPPNHPSIYNENGEKQQCPFAQAAGQEDNAEEKEYGIIGKWIPMSLITKLSPFFQIMGPHLFVSSIISFIPFSYILYKKM